VFFLNLSGGEIFMRPDLFEIIEHARKLQFSVKLKTNGVMIRKAKAERLAKQSAWVTWAAMLLQLVLLGAVAMLLRWQWRNRRAAEAAAARSSARALSVLQTVREPMAVVDKDLRVVLHNPAFTEVFASNGEGTGTGSPIASFGGGTWDLPETRQRLADVLARDRELWDHEISHRGEDGRERTLLVNARRMALPR